MRYVLKPYKNLHLGMTRVFFFLRRSLAYLLSSKRYKKSLNAYVSSRRLCMLRTSLRVRNIYLNVFSREIYMIDTIQKLELPRTRRIASNSD